MGFEVEIGEEIATIRHSYTRFKVNLHAFDCVYKDGAPVDPDLNWKWVYPKQLKEIPVPAANRKLIHMLQSISERYLQT